MKKKIILLLFTGCTLLAVVGGVLFWLSAILAGNYYLLEICSRLT